MNMCNKNWTIVASSYISEAEAACPVVPSWDDGTPDCLLKWLQNQKDYSVAMLIISNRTARLFQLSADRERLQLVQSVRIKTDYVYVTTMYHDCLPKIFNTELDAFVYAQHIAHGRPIMISKFTTRWFGKPGAMYGEPTTPNAALLYDKTQDIPTDNPQKMYDYLMRIAGCELVEYNQFGDRIKSYWVIGDYLKKGYSDFMNPAFVQEMIHNFECPIWWSHEYDTVIDYGNVLTGSNITHMKID